MDGDEWRLGIGSTGVFADSHEFITNHPLILQSKGLRFALLNYTYGTNGLPTPDGLSVNRIDSFNIARDIALIDRTKIDGIIVFFHWGYEYARQPNDEQRKLADLCHRYGAEIVIGSHPHVVQPIVTHEDTYMDYSGREKKNIGNITIYSLGNLVSNQRERYKDGGILVILDIMKKKEAQLAIHASCIPVWVQLPKYRILPPFVADTITMSASERSAYEQFISDTHTLLSPKTE